MATTTNFGWETPDDTDLVKDGALAIRTLGSAIDTSLVDLKGGTTGQVLSKTSNTDMDFTWVAQDDSNAIQNAIVDAKGDIITATANDTPARLAVGTNGQVLTADSTTATGLKWAAASSGAGNMVQIATGTLSGASVTISSLSSYDNLVLFLDGYTNSTANGYVLLRINNDNTSNYKTNGLYFDASSFQNYASNLDNIYVTTDFVDRTNTAQSANIKLTNCKSTGFTDWQSNARAYTGSNKAYFYRGVFTKSEAVSSLVILNSGGNWAGGNYTLWGA